MNATGQQSTTPVMVCSEMPEQVLAELLRRYGLRLCKVPDSDTIPGSFWGDSEAGLVQDRVYVRADTPVHSLLHEACHYVCMDAGRRAELHTDAAGDYAEENAVCYLQILLADQLSEVGRTRLMADMDTWGYSFRLGSAERWFTDDAEDAREWLRVHGLINIEDVPTWRLR